ncbi:hypothetical protein [Streptomyces sp. FH025]|uniref:hypothetical protein n=1 Tax=Streptomyces sp. FH025 TaxID=2815937 RepID=UPI001A9F5A21|nr:hypothetical protein [Streptomyces sp. FH025]MBO1419077.1 hypothetical protein [Streptomyces sp. FH025]
MEPTRAIYHGSKTELHGRIFTVTTNEDCAGHPGGPFGGLAECIVLLAPDGTGLQHVHPRSFTVLAPDGDPIHRDAQDGDWTWIPGRGDVRFAYAEPGTSRWTLWIHYYAFTGRWIILSEHVRRDDHTATRSRYTSPQDLLAWRIRVCLDDLAADRNHAITDAYERCADRLEQRMQALELAPPAAPRTGHPAATR